LGNLAEAKRLLQKAVAILEQVVDDPGHSLLASSYSNLATVEQASGNFAEAKRLMQQAVAIWERNTNLKTPSLGTGYFNLATVEQVLGNVTNAESLYQRALAIRETVLGPLHPDVANCLHGLAVTYINQGRYAQAAPLMERAIEILLRASQSTGSAHPYLQKTVNNYVTLLDRMGRSREEAMVQLNQLGGAFGFHFGG
jgi:tetratricopeptide (TPR) repeat protein